MPLHPSLSNVSPVSRRLGESVLAVMGQIDDVRRANASASSAGKVSLRLVPPGKLDRLAGAVPPMVIDEASPMSLSMWRERPEAIARRAVLESGIAEAALDEYDQQALIDWYRLDLETEPAAFVECVISILETLGENDLVAECCRAAIEGGVLT